jgi:hypothetical protein
VFPPVKFRRIPPENSLAKSGRTNHPTRCLKTAFYATTTKRFIDLMRWFLCLCINLLVEIQFFPFLRRGRPKCTRRFGYILHPFLLSLLASIGSKVAAPTTSRSISSFVDIYLPIPCKSQPYCVGGCRAGRLMGLSCALALLCNANKQRILATPGSRFDPRDT